MTSRRKRNRPDKRAEAERLAAEDASADRQYLAGLHLGFSLGVINDTATLERINASRRRDLAAAAQEIGARDD